MEWIDLSLTIDGECMTCGTPWHIKPEINPLGRLETVGRNTSEIRLGSHSATHLDAPLHFLNGAYGVDEIPLEKLCGRVQVVDMTHKHAGSRVEKKDLEGVVPSPKMLFRFGWYKHWQTKQYYRDFPFFSLEALQYLLDGGLEMLALDTPSPDTGAAIGSLQDDSPGHKLLLKQKAVIVEYLSNTDGLEAGDGYEIAALPLKLRGCDGSPARVIIRRIEKNG